MARQGTPVWITRAEPGAGETAAAVRALGLGLAPVVEPLLEVRTLEVGAADLADIGALAFTSANAVRAFAARWPERAWPVFAVGAATARAARDAGFGAVVSAEGDVAALARTIIATRSERSEGVVLHAAAAEPAGDLIGALASAGVPARRLALYETVARAPGPAAAALLSGEALALLHSPRAAAALRDWMAPRDACRLTALCLSPAVGAALGEARLARVRAAPAPNEAALMALLADEAGGG
jgi:uroporphyrinogen-III synthase